MLSGKVSQCRPRLAEGGLPGLVFRDVEIVRSGVGERSENHLGITFAACPFVIEVVHLALRDPNANGHLRSDLRTHGLQNRKHQLDAGARIAAPAIVAPVGGVGEELVEKVAVRAVDLDCVETRDLDRPQCGRPESVDRIGDLHVIHRLRFGVGALAIIEGELLALGLDRGRADGFRPEAVAWLMAPACMICATASARCALIPFTMGCHERAWVSSLSPGWNT